VDQHELIRRLERQNRLLVACLVISVIAGSLSAVVALHSPSSAQAAEKARKTTETERLVLKDARGRIRAELTVNDADQTELTFWDKDKNEVLQLYDVGGAGKLELKATDRSGEVVVTALGKYVYMVGKNRGGDRFGINLGVSEDGPGLKIFQVRAPKAVSRIDLRCGADGSELILRDEKGKRTHSLP
jgi:hypothetical protein